MSDKIIWVSGTEGTVLRSTNAGKSWINVSPSFGAENASTFQFRDIQAWSAHSAIILSIGEGNASRIYKTQDGGRNWKLVFVNEEPAAFYDCIAFKDENVGLALSDPVDGRFRILRTTDGGATWGIVGGGSIPRALEGEFAFAASGTCLTFQGSRWYFASGGVSPGRIFSAGGNGDEWTVADSKIKGGEAAGVFSVQFRGRRGIAVGGDFQVPNGTVDNASWSSDAGISWQKATSFPSGYRSGVSWVPGAQEIAIAVGPSGSDLTLDSGRSWRHFDSGSFDSVECLSEDVCWASGSRGRVARLEFGET